MLKLQLIVAASDTTSLELNNESYDCHSRDQFLIVMVGLEQMVVLGGSIVVIGLQTL